MLGAGIEAAGDTIGAAIKGEAVGAAMGEAMGTPLDPHGELLEALGDRIAAATHVGEATE